MKILFVHQGIQSFVQTDLEILRSNHEVRECYFPGVRRNWFFSFKHIGSLLRGILWCDLTFSWFGKLHAFFAVIFSKVLGKKSVVVVSGGEVCRFSFGNGRYKSLCSKPIKRWFPLYIVRQADLILPVSYYVYKEAIKNVDTDPHRMEMIYHGFDTTWYRRLPGTEKQRIAITVGEIMEENLYNKGLADFIAAAELAPDVSYMLIGPDRDHTAEKLRAQLPKNAVMSGGLYGNDLIEQMSQAAVYVQASVMESFGCAVAEAMACECIPVVTHIPALEEVVGDCGIYLNEPVTPEEIAAKVKVALQHPELGKRARQRVVEKFSLEKRRKALLEAVNSLSSDYSNQLNSRIPEL